eukprot:567068-Rhodomonas_salina.1
MKARDGEKVRRSARVACLGAPQPASSMSDIPSPWSPQHRLMLVGMHDQERQVRVLTCFMSPSISSRSIGPLRKGGPGKEGCRNRQDEANLVFSLIWLKTGAIPQTPQQQTNISKAESENMRRNLTAVWRRERLRRRRRRGVRASSPA